MHFLRCVLAEWALVRPRLSRTRFGIWLLLLGAALVWVGTHGAEPITVALHAGALGAVLGATFAAGSPADRAALTITLAHPTTPLAVACGRWLAALIPAAALTVACTFAAGGHARAALAGIVAAAAVAGCALAAVLVAGTAPATIVGVAEPSAVRFAVASALELGPALWRYRDVATRAGGGGAGAILHAVAWAALGVVLARGCVSRRTCGDR